jgi:hypothetical protein
MPLRGDKNRRFKALSRQIHRMEECPVNILVVAAYDRGALAAHVRELARGRRGSNIAFDAGDEGQETEMMATVKDACETRNRFAPLTIVLHNIDQCKRDTAGRIKGFLSRAPSCSFLASTSSLPRIHCGLASRFQVVRLRSERKPPSDQALRVARKLHDEMFAAADTSLQTAKICCGAAVHLTDVAAGLLPMLHDDVAMRACPVLAATESRMTRTDGSRHSLIQWRLMVLQLKGLLGPK